jgi:lipoprotein-anchoring transpeptidase ErfK/SrfK
VGLTDDGWLSRNDVECLLRDAFTARAHAAISDLCVASSMSGTPRRSRHLAWVVPAVLLVVAATVLAAVAADAGGRRQHRSAASVPIGPVSSLPATGRQIAPSMPATRSRTSTRRSAHTVVHVTALQNDGATYGVGMPIVLYFRPAPTRAAAFEKAVTVTVNGRAARGSWFWEQPTADEVRAHVVEAHYRLATYWPADSRVHVGIPIGGLSAGKGLVFSDRLTSLDFAIGDAHISTIDAGSLTMRVTSNGRFVHRMRVSLGAAATPTFNGVKVVMQKGENVPGTDRLRPDGTVLMSGPTYTDHPVPWSVRVTESGEYVHAAPWNHGIGESSTSNGCTNLRTADAAWFYSFARVGDVLRYDHTDGTTMPSWDGLGDWNISWPQWTRGGLLGS